MNYMVMECHPAYAVVLAEDGRFLKVANMHYEVGQTVPEVVQIQLPETVTPVKSSRRWVKTVAAMAACLTLAFSSLFYVNQMPYASVYLTINPEVRIDVNRRDAVVDVEGVNLDGETLVEGYEHKGKELDLVMDELVDRAIDMGYLHEGGTIKLSLDADEEWIGSHSEHLNAHLNEHLAEVITVTIDVEQKKAPEETPEPEIPVQPIVIPVAPEAYGESDYGDDREEDGKTNYDDSDEEDADDGQTDYDSDKEEDGESDYKAPTTTKRTEDKDSEYDSSAVKKKTESTDDGQSEYAAEEKQSDYDEPEADSDDGASDYQEAAESDDGDSEYAASKKASKTTVKEEEGQSEYEEEREDSEEGDSEYEEEDEEED